MESWILWVSCKVRASLTLQEAEVFMILWTFQKSNSFLKWIVHAVNKCVIHVFSSVYVSPHMAFASSKKILFSISSWTYKNGTNWPSFIGFVCLWMFEGWIVWFTCVCYMSTCLIDLNKYISLICSCRYILQYCPHLGLELQCLLKVKEDLSKYGYFNMIY